VGVTGELDQVRESSDGDAALRSISAAMAASVAPSQLPMTSFAVDSPIRT
jgi:hypothetical protein